MLRELTTALKVAYEEAKHRRWFKVLRVLIAFLGFLGFSVAVLHPTLERLFPTSVVAVWVIIVSFTVTICLLIALSLVQSFHRRAAATAVSVWTKNTGLLAELYILRQKGRQLSNQCDHGPSSFPHDEVERWHPHVAGILERGLGIEYRRRFYEHSKTGEAAPDDSYRCHEWVETRLVKLERVIHELEQPSRLISHAPSIPPDRTSA